MSASSKKKLRKEQNLEQLTQRQLQEQKEAKKTKLMTTLFIVGLAVILVAFIAIAVSNVITSSGVIGKWTTVATVGEHKLSMTDFNYYYVDTVNEVKDGWYSTVQQYTEALEMTSEEAIMNMMGIDVTKPMSELIYDEESGQTWADYMIEEALTNARRDYILYDAAIAAGFKLSEEDQATVDQIPANLEGMASWTQFGSAKALIREGYGYGEYANVDSYTAYVERGMIADAYYEYYSEQLSYDDAALRAAEGETPEDYNSYSYAYFTVDVEEFLEGGTEAEDGTVTYSDEEKEAARAKAEAAATALTAATSVEEFDDLVAHVYVAEETTEEATEEATEESTEESSEEAAEESEVVEDEHDHEHETSIKSTDVLHSNSKTEFREFLSAEATVKGSTTILPAKDKETEEITGYYAIYVMAKSDNTKAPVNVRHLLVQVDDTDDEEAWAAAKTSAELLLEEWNNGDKTEESFSALVTENTDDTASAETGGLYEDVRETSSYVENFLNWCVDESRKAGDTGIVETEYGYHIMYFVEHQEQSYRDQMLSDKLRTEDTQEWFTGLADKTPLTKNEKNIKKIDKDMVSLSSAY